MTICLFGRVLLLFPSINSNHDNLMSVVQVIKNFTSIYFFRVAIWIMKLFYICSHRRVLEHLFHQIPLLQWNGYGGGGFIRGKKWWIWGAVFTQKPQRLDQQFQSFHFELLSWAQVEQDPWPLQKSKHLKGQLGTRVTDVKFFNRSCQFGPASVTSRFFSCRGQLRPGISDVKLF